MSWKLHVPTYFIPRLLLSVLYPSAAHPSHLFVQGPGVLAHHPKAFELLTLLPSHFHGLPSSLLTSVCSYIKFNPSHRLTVTHCPGFLSCCFAAVIEQTRSNVGRKGFLWFPGDSPSPWGNQGRNTTSDCFSYLAHLSRHGTSYSGLGSHQLAIEKTPQRPI